MIVELYSTAEVLLVRIPVTLPQPAFINYQGKIYAWSSGVRYVEFTAPVPCPEGVAQVSPTQEALREPD